MLSFNKIYNFLQSCYIIGRTSYDNVFYTKPDYNTNLRKITLIELNSVPTKYDITVTIKDTYYVSDINEFIKKSNISLDSCSNYFIEFEYTVAGRVYKYLREYAVSTPGLVQVFPVYTSNELELFYTDNVPNGILLSNVNDEYDITDELHKYAGPKGDFYQHFKVDWIKLLDSVPSDLNWNNLIVEILTYHGKTYTFTNEDELITIN